MSPRFMTARRWVVVAQVPPTTDGGVAMDGEVSLVETYWTRRGAQKAVDARNRPTQRWSYGVMSRRDWEEHRERGVFLMTPQPETDGAKMNPNPGPGRAHDWCCSLDHADDAACTPMTEPVRYDSDGFEIEVPCPTCGQYTAEDYAPFKDEISRLHATVAELEAELAALRGDSVRLESTDPNLWLAFRNAFDEPPFDFGDLTLDVLAEAAVEVAAHHPRGTA